MTLILWLSDLHMDHALPHTRDPLFTAMEQARPDLAILTGDVSHSINLANHLTEIVRVLRCPLYFVLGNHDCYRGSIAFTRTRARTVADALDNAHYLPDCGIVELDARTALVGHDGWPDARNGDYEHTPMELNDFYNISDFHGMNRWERARLMQQLAQESADHLERVLPGAAARYERVIVATHVPPFEDAAWYGGSPSSQEALPFFTSRVAGAIIRHMADSYPRCRFTVLCGHAHERHECHPAGNLYVWTAGARYGFPAIERVIDTGEPKGDRSTTPAVERQTRGEPETTTTGGLYRDEEG